MKPSLHKQRGGVLILFALCLPVLLGVLGLALDSSMAYLIKAKLSASADAAVLAAGEAIERGASNPEKERNARDAATQLFNANFPTNYLGAAVGLDRIDIRWTGASFTITLSAHATYATTLGRLLGQNELRVNVAPQVTKNSGAGTAVDVALVIDSSNSLTGYMDDVKRAVKDYVTQLNPTTDRIALVQFGDYSKLELDGSRSLDGATVEVPFKTPGIGFDQTVINQKIDGLAPKGTTPTAAAFIHAKEQLDLIKDPTFMQYVLMFTDGTPTESTPGSHTRPSIEAENKAEALRQAGFPIYLIGFRMTPDGVNQMNCWANTNTAAPSCQRPTQPQGKVCLSTDAASLAACFQQSGPSRGAGPLVLSE